MSLNEIKSKLQLWSGMCPLVKSQCTYLLQSYIFGTSQLVFIYRGNWFGHMSLKKHSWDLSKQLTHL